MTSSLDIAKEAVRISPRANLAGWCQLYAGLCISAFLGKEAPGGYSNATAAYRASKIVSLDPNTAPPGAMHYFEYPVGQPNGDGHVGMALGSGLMASATSRTAGTIQDLGKNVRVHNVATYGLKYLGWSLANGTRPAITGLTDENAMKPNQRKVGSIETRQRTEPTTKASYDGAKNLKAGTIITPEGWVTGENVQNSTVWFKTPAGLYSHSSGFTNKTTTGLKDLNRTPLDDAKDALREALKANEEATKNLTSSSGKIEEALKLLEGN